MRRIRLTGNRVSAGRRRHRRLPPCADTAVIYGPRSRTRTLPRAPAKSTTLCARTRPMTPSTRAPRAAHIPAADRATPHPARARHPPYERPPRWRADAGDLRADCPAARIPCEKAKTGSIPEVPPDSPVNLRRIRRPRTAQQILARIADPAELPVLDSV